MCVVCVRVCICCVNYMTRCDVYNQVCLRSQSYCTYRTSIRGLHDKIKDGLDLHNVPLCTSRTLPVSTYRLDAEVEETKSRGPWAVGVTSVSEGATKLSK